MVRIHFLFDIRHYISWSRFSVIEKWERQHVRLQITLLSFKKKFTKIFHKNLRVGKKLTRHLTVKLVTKCSLVTTVPPPPPLPAQHSRSASLPAGRCRCPVDSVGTGRCLGGLQLQLSSVSYESLSPWKLVNQGCTRVFLYVDRKQQRKPVAQPLQLRIWNSTRR